MSRDYELYVADMLDAIGAIQSYTRGLAKREFASNRLVKDAVIRNLEVIGEAAKNIPDDVRPAGSGVEWRKITGLRDVLAHAYFGVDDDIVWDIVENKLEPLKQALKSMPAVRR